MKLMTMKQYMKMSTTALMRKINKELRAMPKAKLARLCYNLTKSKLPRLKVRKSLAYNGSISRKRNIKNTWQKRRASPKQIAWRKKFAKMSKAGTLRKRRC